MKILFLVPYPVKRSPSQRFRFEQYFKALTQAGHHYTVQSFLTRRGWKIIYSKEARPEKVLVVLYGFLRRFFVLPVLLTVDVVFIHREAAPVGPPVVEWIIAKIFRKKIIYDFDDAIWLTDNKNESGLQSTIRWRSKVSSIISWSHKVSCGNEFLCAYARQFNKNVVRNPTTIDTTYHKPAAKEKTNSVVVGWTGSHTTLKYLSEIVPAIQQLEKKYTELVFLVIANEEPDLSITSLRFQPWRVESEIADLAMIDIGVMPLPDDEWSKGKCGFKALQYMSLGIPALVSPVGVNTEIVTNKVNGVICKTTDEWIDAIEWLIKDAGARRKLGEAGRENIEKNYSVSSNTSTFLSLFDRSAIIASATK